MATNDDDLENKTNVTELETFFAKTHGDSLIEEFKELCRKHNVKGLAGFYFKDLSYVTVTNYLTSLEACGLCEEIKYNKQHSTKRG